MLSAILGALRVGVVPVLLNPALLDHERDLLLADADPRWSSTTRVLAELLAATQPVELAPAPLARPMHYTSGTTGRPKGVWSGVLDETRGAGPASRGGRAVALRRRRPPPGLLAVAPLGVDPLRRRHAARPGATWCVLGKFDALRGARRHEPSCDHHRVHGPGPPATPLRSPTRRPTDVVPAARPRRLRPARRRSSTRRSTPSRPAPCGSSTARPKASSPPARARSGSTDRARSVGRGPHRRIDGRRRRHDLVRRAALRPLDVLAATPRPPSGPGAPTPSRSATSAARRRRLPLARRSARRPHHHRRRQRVPGRGRAALAARPAWSRWPSSASTTSAGASACAPRSSATPTADAIAGLRPHPARGLQVPQAGLRRRRPAAHQHGQGAPPRPGRAPVDQAGS